MSEAYYRRLGPGRYAPTEHTAGAWLEGEQHMAPVSALIVAELESAAGRPELQTARLSFEILGVIPRETTEVTARLVRPGRTVELWEATVSAGGRPVVLARAWRLGRSDTAAVAGGAPDPLPPPEDLPAWQPGGVWIGGYIVSVEVKVVPGSVPGRARAWARSGIEVVADEPTSALARFVSVVDTANGIGSRVSPLEWRFPNTDLSLHLFRSPEAGQGWVGFDTAVAFGPTGVGLTSTTLYDQRGAVGRAEQILTLRPT